MGEVYQATDSKLGRSVAIKFLPEAFSHDGDGVARFQHEARVLASLNHPNVAAIYGVEEIGGRHFLVMELVPGDTLEERIRRSPLPLGETLVIAKQIAEALEETRRSCGFTRDGTVTPITGMQPKFRLAPRILPDGVRIASSEVHINKDIWIFDSARGTEDRASFEGQNAFAIWSPTGSQVAFRSDRAVPQQIYPGSLRIVLNWTQEVRQLLALR